MTSTKECTLYLNTALDKIQWHDSSVSEATTEETAESAERVELTTANFTAVLGTWELFEIRLCNLCNNLKVY